MFTANAQTEITNLFKGSYNQVYFRNTKDDGKSHCINLIQECQNIVCIITCDYVGEKEICKFDIHLHYDSCFHGSKEFQEILKKYNLHFEWQECCIATLVEI